MRGLKLYEKLKKAGVLPVASFTDAWIETHHAKSIYFPCSVASFTDAWIETEG